VEVAKLYGFSLSVFSDSFGDSPRERLAFAFEKKVETAQVQILISVKHERLGRIVGSVARWI
jgi:hypothetical protein